MAGQCLIRQSDVILCESRRSTKTREWQIGLGMGSYISTNGALAASNNTADCSVRVGRSSLCHLASFNHCEPGATHVNVGGMLIVQNRALGGYK